MVEVDFSRLENKGLIVRKKKKIVAPLVVKRYMEVQNYATRYFLETVFSLQNELVKKETLLSVLAIELSKAVADAQINQAIANRVLAEYSVTLPRFAQLTKTLSYLRRKLEERDLEATIKEDRIRSLEKLVSRLLELQASSEFVPKEQVINLIQEAISKMNSNGRNLIQNTNQP